MYKKNTVVITYKDEVHTFHFRRFGSNSIVIMLYQQGDPNNAVKLGYIDPLGHWSDTQYHMYWQVQKEVVKTYIKYKFGLISRATHSELDGMKFKEYKMIVFEEYLKERHNV